LGVQSDAFFGDGVLLFIVVVVVCVFCMFDVVVGVKKE
jgi:hypothetical protein